MMPAFGEPALGVDGGHAAGAGGGHRLAIVTVSHVAGGEDAFDARVGAERLRVFDIALRVEPELPPDRSRFSERSAAECPARKGKTLQNSTSTFPLPPGASSFWSVKRVNFLPGTPRGGTGSRWASGSLRCPKPRKIILSPCARMEFVLSSSVKSVVGSVRVSNGVM